MFSSERRSVRQHLPRHTARQVVCCLWRSQHSCIPAVTSWWWAIHPFTTICISFQNSWPFVSSEPNNESPLNSLAASLWTKPDGIIWFRIVFVFFDQLHFLYQIFASMSSRDTRRAVLRMPTQTSELTEWFHLSDPNHLLTSCVGRRSGLVSDRMDIQEEHQHRNCFFRFHWLLQEIYVSNVRKAAFIWLSYLAAHELAVFLFG